MGGSSGRIETRPRVRVACAVDTVPLLAARTANLLSWGRRITLASRYLESKSLDLMVGLTVNGEQSDHVGRGYGCRGTEPADYAGFSVHLTPGGHFGFAAYNVDGNATEDGVWERFHRGQRRQVTIVELTGGGVGERVPGAKDGIVITSWNRDCVGRQTVIGFDTSAFYDAWNARETRGWTFGDRPLDVRYCEQLAREGPYRVRCSYPLADDVCAGAADHVVAGTAEPSTGREAAGRG